MTIRAVLELGYPTESMPEVLDIALWCMRQRVKRFNRDGLEGLRDKPKPGRSIAKSTSSCRTRISTCWNRLQIVKKTVHFTKDLTHNQILERANVLRTAYTLNELCCVAIGSSQPAEYG